MKRMREEWSILPTSVVYNYWVHTKFVRSGSVEVPNLASVDSGDTESELKNINLATHFGQGCSYVHVESSESSTGTGLHCCVQQC